MSVIIITHSIAAVPGSEAFLLTTETEGLLIDSGCDFCAATLAAQIKRILGSRPLTAILVTHSHYDHVSGCAGIKQLYPDAAVVASALTASLLKKETVRQTIRDLNRKSNNNTPYADRIDCLHIDQSLSDKQQIRLCGQTITALETPGHTRCCISYYFHEAELLVCSESIGAWIGGKLLPAFIVSYPSALESIKKCAGMNPKRIIVPHYGELDAADVPVFFANAQRIAKDAADFVYQLHAKGMEPAAIVQAYIKRYYTEKNDLPEEAVFLNTTAMVKNLLRNRTLLV